MKRPRGVRNAATDSRPAVVPPTLGELILGALEERWQTFNGLLEDVRQKASTRKVHDLRIALRRMVSVLDLVKDMVGGRPARKLAKRLKKLLEELGTLRDTQVQRKEIGRMAERWPALDDFHARLRRREEKLEGRAERDLRQLDLEKLRDRFGEVAADALLALSSTALQERHRVAVLEAVDRRFSDVIEARRALDVASLETMHRMRVCFKKFRYMAEVLTPILVGMGKAQLDSMQAFQTMMGDVHDLDVLNQMLAVWRSRHAKQSNDLVAAQDDVGRRLLQRTDALFAAADEIFTFWNQSYLPPT